MAWLSAVHKDCRDKPDITKQFWSTIEMATFIPIKLIQQVEWR